MGQTRIKIYPWGTVMSMQAGRAEKAGDGRILAEATPYGTSRSPFRSKYEDEDIRMDPLRFHLGAYWHKQPGEHFEYGDGTGQGYAEVSSERLLRLDRNMNVRGSSEPHKMPLEDDNKSLDIYEDGQHGFGRTFKISAEYERYALVYASDGPAVRQEDGSVVGGQYGATRNPATSPPVDRSYKDPFSRYRHTIYVVPDENHEYWNIGPAGRERFNRGARLEVDNPRGDHGRAHPDQSPESLWLKYIAGEYRHGRTPDSNRFGFNNVDGEGVQTSNWGAFYNNDFNHWYEDWAFEMPIAVDESLVSGRIANDKTYNLEMNYNFYDKNYEEVATGWDVQTTDTEMRDAQFSSLLPNIYFFGAQKDSEEREAGKNFMEHITLAGELNDSRFENEDFRLKDMTGSYFKEYARQFDMAMQGENRSRLVNLAKNRSRGMIFYPGSVKKMAEYNKAAELFPMYADLRFSSDSNMETPIVNGLIESGLYRPLMKEIIYTLQGTNNGVLWVGPGGQISADISLGGQKSHLWHGFKKSDDSDATRAAATWVVPNTWNRDYRTEEAGNNPEGSGQLDSWDLTPFFRRGDEEYVNTGIPGSTVDGFIANQTGDWASGLDSYVSQLVDFNTVSIGAPQPQDQTTSAESFLRNLQEMIFKSKFGKIVDEKARSYYDILDGKKAHSETLFYEIVRTERGVDNRPFVTRTYIANADEVDKIRFIDTQVKYGGMYEYSVYAIQVVVGTKYRYINREEFFTENGVVSNVHGKINPGFWGDDRERAIRAIRGQGQDKPYASMTVEYEPVLKVVRVPYAGYDWSDPLRPPSVLTTGLQHVSLLDSPPVAPDATIIPYRGSSDSVLINLNSGVGEYAQMPVAIEDTDEEIQRQAYHSATRLEFGMPMVFKSDDPPAAFQIFRIETRPKSYNDFKNNMLINIATQGASSTGYKDTIEANKKYYYTARSIDVHGNISNPCGVWEVEIIDENGALYTNIRMVEFEEPIVGKKTIAAKEYIQIAPSLGHTLVDQVELEKQARPAGGEWDDTAPQAGTVPLGMAEESIWGKRFKIRLTSKTTGRKIDLDVDVKRENI